jgi:hypothetical protein
LIPGIPSVSMKNILTIDHLISSIENTEENFNLERDFFRIFNMIYSIGKSKKNSKKKFNQFMQSFFFFSFNALPIIINTYLILDQFYYQTAIYFYSITNFISFISVINLIFTGGSWVCLIRNSWVFIYNFSKDAIKFV